MTGSATPLDRAALADAVLTSLPPAAEGVLPHDRLVAEDNGHAFGKSWHVGWLWGVDDAGRPWVDVLAQHRMAGSWLDRFHADGEVEHLDAPGTTRLASRDPVQDARLGREFVARQRQLVDDLRARGLLPPPGENITSIEINELLATERSDPPTLGDGVVEDR